MLEAGEVIRVSVHWAFPPTPVSDWSEMGLLQAVRCQLFLGASLDV